MITIDTFDFKGQRAIVRVDFNVPLNEEGKILWQVFLYARHFQEE